METFSMKKRAALALLAFTSLAHAQSSVILYGSLDAGVTYLNNVRGSSTVLMEKSNLQPDRFGLKGVEDLGGGYKAIFQLETGFSPLTGALISSGTIFNRQAFVGIGTPVGYVTLGHQQNFNQDILNLYSSGFLFDSFYAFHPGNIDDLADTFQFDNSVKFRSLSFGGFSVGAMFGFSNVPGQFSTGSNYSFGTNYINGPVEVGAAYSNEHNRHLNLANSFGVSSFNGVPVTSTSLYATDKVQNWGAGGTYRFTSAQVYALFTQTRITARGRTDSMNNIDVGLNYQISPFDFINATTTYSKIGPHKWNLFGLNNIYLLSKSTQLYTTVLFQKASGDGTVAVLNGFGPSSTNKQIAVMAGIHHSF
ncbi:porin [Burkholderia cepacia]|uniref:porin n=1 Tax=Burkholderia cepacia TaxID=292 RepID=UPI002AB63AE2|nr:porin [Burkholderia cepacia]